MTGSRSKAIGCIFFPFPCRSVPFRYRYFVPLTKTRPMLHYLIEETNLMSTKPSCPIAIKIYRKSSAFQNDCEKKNQVRWTSYLSFWLSLLEHGTQRTEGPEREDWIWERRISRQCRSEDRSLDDLEDFFKLDELEECRNRSWLWERILADCDSTKGSA